MSAARHVRRRPSLLERIGRAVIAVGSADVSQLDRADGVTDPSAPYTPVVHDHEPVRVVREAQPPFDQNVHEALAAARSALPPLLPMRVVDALVTAGQASADVREDYLDAKAATADQLWDIFETETEATR